MFTRKQFLQSCALSAPFISLAGPSFAAEEADQQLKQWELIELPRRKRSRFVKITAADGSVGYCRALGNCQGLRSAAEAVSGMSLLDHAQLYKRMVQKRVPEEERQVLDIAAWDLHARMHNQPLHALLGSKKKKILRYGDVRGTGPDFVPKQYAEKVASYLDRTGLKATKLHFPGAMGTADSLTMHNVLTTLEATRKAVGDETILAWDPYPRTAESATHSLDEAKKIIRHMDDLGYAWIEGPLPPVPFDQQIPKYVQLMEMQPKLRIQAEGPRSPIGDGTPLEAMKQWVKAGAVNQCSTDAYIRGGLTHAKQFLDYAEEHRESGLVINLHWAWAPHAHLAMAYDNEIIPLAEFPMTEDIPPGFLDGPYLRAPDWPGIYQVG